MIKSFPSLWIGLTLGLIFTLPAAAQETVSLMAFGGLFQERYTKTVIEPFEKANPGITVTYTGFPASGQMLGTLRAQKANPQVDIAVLDVTVAKAGTDEGIFAKLDPAEIKNISLLRPEARFADVNGVGVTFDNFDIVYNSEAVRTPLLSLRDLAAPELRGKVAFSGMPDIIGLSAMIVLDKSNDGPGLSGHLTQGFDEMSRIAPNVLTWEPQPDVYTLVINGQASAGLGWNARSQYYAKQSGGKLRAVIPAEGTVFQINTINLVAKPQITAAAKRFVDYALSAEAQLRFSEDLFYAPTNSTVQLGPDTLSRIAVSQSVKIVPVDWIAVAKSRDVMMDLWRRRIVPLSR